MNHLPFDKPGRFYRGNLHTHSTSSDGRLGLTEVVAVYRDYGYDFLAITDHFVERYGFPLTDTRQFRTDTFTTLLGAELHAPRTALGENYHLLAVGLPLDFAPTAAGETGPTLAERAAGTGAFVGIAHPAWYGLTLSDALAVEAAHSVEVYNETCVAHNDRGDSWATSDLLSVHGRRLTACAVDDAHFAARPDHRAAWVHVRAEQLEPAALLAALKAGHFYSSQGPQLHEVAIAAGRIHVACSPARAVFITGRAATACSIRGEAVAEGEFPLDQFQGSYCRVTVVDAAGRRAWSNPIWLDQVG
ncbi:MAG: CehA/McbA family metallohydrolase [Chloroflexi bacterium]|nr:CehA/McbA family metallohydrolase [Chloroflexota bacterium]